MASHSRSGDWSLRLLQVIGRSSSKLFEGHFGPCEHRQPLRQRPPAYHVSAFSALPRQRHLRCSLPPSAGCSPNTVHTAILGLLHLYTHTHTHTLAATTLKNLHRTQRKPPTYMCNRSFSLCTRTQPPLSRPVWHRVRPQSCTYRHHVLTVSSRSHPRRSLEWERHTFGRLHPRSQR